MAKGKGRRKGRPRKPGPRENNGRLQRARKDRGSVALQVARALAVPEGKDLALASYPLGVLHANGEIDRQEHQAGCEYAWLHHIVYGRATVAASKLERIPQGLPAEPDEAFLERCQADLGKVDAALSEAEQAIVYRIAVAEETPRFMRPLMPNHADIANARTLKRGLGIVAEQLGLKPLKARNAA